MLPISIFSSLRLILQVWIDLKETPDGTLESLTRAVERAAAVIICHSATYQRSEYCRTQVEYAHRLLKPLFCIEAETEEMMAPWFLHTTGDPATWVKVDPRLENSWPQACAELQAQLGELGKVSQFDTPTIAQDATMGSLENVGEARVRVAEQRAARSERRLRTLQNRVVHAAGPATRGLRPYGETPELTDDDEHQYHNVATKSSQDYSYAWAFEHAEPLARAHQTGSHAMVNVDETTRRLQGDGLAETVPRPRGNAMSFHSTATLPTLVGVTDSTRRRSSSASSVLYSRAAALPTNDTDDVRLTLQSTSAETVSELVRMVQTLTAKVDELLALESQRSSGLPCCPVM